MPYCTIEDIRKEGVLETEYTDTHVERLINLATAYIDTITRQWFEIREMAIAFDGTGGKTLYLPVFLVTADKITIDGEEISDYKLYNRFFPDDRRNPKIFRKAGWPEGCQNIIVEGRWGYVDKVGDEYITPPLIVQTAKRLVLRELPLLSNIEGQEQRKRARIISETTDGHSYTLEKLAAGFEYTGDPDIDMVLTYYRAPIALGGA